MGKSSFDSRRPRDRSKSFVARRSATGFGLFAAKPLDADRRLLEYVGPRLTESEAVRRGGRYLVEIAPGRYVDGSEPANLARYVNHSCAPNCEIRIERGRVWIRSTRAIDLGEELTADYGGEYVARFFGRSGCRCASCRESTRPPTRDPV